MHRKGSVITTVDFRSESIFGFLLLAGTDAGSVVLYDAATLKEFKVVQTNGGGAGAARSRAGTAARGRVDSSGSGGSGGAGASREAAATSVVACLNPTSFFAGHTDGVTRCFQLSTGDLQQTFTPPAGANGARAAEVTGLAVYSSNPAMLAVAHKDGAINNYNLQTGEFLLSFSTQPGLTGLLSLRRFNSLAAIHEGKNTLQVWDLDSDRVLLLDFAAELESIHRKTSKMTCARYDDARGVIIAGSDDGTVYVRQVARIEGTKDLSIKLVRVCTPTATATGPSKVLCMWYETRFDLLLTGDLSGLCRRLERVTGASLLQSCVRIR